MTVSAPRSYTGRVLVAVAIAALAFLAWRLLDVVIVAFGAVLIATALRTLAVPLAQRTKLPERLALLAVVLLLLVALVLGSWLLGDRLIDQFGALREALPKALANAQRWLEGNPFGALLLEAWDAAKSDGTAWSRLAGIASMTLNAAASALLVIAAGVYLAADPGLYRRGVLHLMSRRHRARVDAAMQAAGNGLSRWLLGQAVSMAVIGSATAIGLWLLGIPLALTLGVIAGVLAFVPFFGAITAGILIVMLAFTQAPEQALYAALLCLGVQQAEEFLIVPFVQRRAVRLPPALGLFAVLIFGLLFGIVGALFATPLMVVVMILVQRLYVHDVVES